MYNLPAGDSCYIRAGDIYIPLEILCMVALCSPTVIPAMMLVNTHWRAAAILAYRRIYASVSRVIDARVATFIDKYIFCTVPVLFSSEYDQCSERICEVVQRMITVAYMRGWQRGRLLTYSCLTKQALRRRTYRGARVMVETTDKKITIAGPRGALVEIASKPSRLFLHHYNTITWPVTVTAGAKSCNGCIDFSFTRVDNISCTTLHARIDLDVGVFITPLIVRQTLCDAEHVIMGAPWLPHYSISGCLEDSLASVTVNNSNCDTLLAMNNRIKTVAGDPRLRELAERASTLSISRMTGDVIEIRYTHESLDDVIIDTIDFRWYPTS